MRWAKFTGVKAQIIFAGILVISCSWGFISTIPKQVAAQTAPPPSYSTKDVTVKESDSVATFTFNVTNPNPDTCVSVSYLTTDGSAKAGTDYVYTASKSPVTICGNGNLPVSVQIINDAVVGEADETFTITFSSASQRLTFKPQTATGTITENDPAPTPTPTPTPPTNTTPTPKPKPPVTPTPTPTPTLTPDPAPTQTPTEPQVLSDTNVVVTLPPLALPQSQERATFVRAVGSPKDIGWHTDKAIKSAFIAALLILLIMFPADLFNSTLQSNYDEVVGWFKLDYVRKLHHKLQLHHMPIAIVLTIFGVLVTLLNVQLSPGLGFNRASLALLLGMFVALSFAAAVYDLSRAWYMSKRFGVSGKLRTHALGLGAGALFVAVSRLAHFVPGYLYGLFTGLIYKQKEPTDKQDGEGLALASVVLLFIAVLGWFALIPMRTIATRPGASFVSLVAESALASLWVSALGTIVFSLAPLRFMYGEQVKKWNKILWAALWGTGMLLFVYTLLDPNQGIYNKSSTASWVTVLSLFIGFGIFSFGFWGYFRFRPARGQTVSQPH